MSWGLVQGAVNAQELVDPSVCLPDSSCNLVNYGDFEAFPSGFKMYYESFESPWDAQYIQVQNALGNVMGNTVDVSANASNQWLSFHRYNLSTQENVLMPLCKEIDPGCPIHITFEACTDNTLNGNQDAFLGVWALSQLPSSLEMPFLTQCNGLLYDMSNNLIGKCIGEVPLNHCPFGPPTASDFHQLELDPGHDFPIKHIWFLGYPSFENKTNYH